MKQFLSQLARNTHGNALMLFAAALVPITLMIGSGIDASITYMARNKLQNACDAGALAGRLAMIGYDWNDGRYQLSAFGRNILDEVVAVGGIDFNNLTGFINEPRTYGVEFRANF